MTTPSTPTSTMKEAERLVRAYGATVVITEACHGEPELRLANEAEVEARDSLLAFIRSLVEAQPCAVAGEAGPAIHCVLPMLERAMKDYAFTGDKAGEVLAAMNTLRRLAAPSAVLPLKGEVPKRKVCDECGGLGHFPLSFPKGASAGKCTTCNETGWAAGEGVAVEPTHLHQHALEELHQLGYTVRDGQLIPPDNLHELAEVAMRQRFRPTPAAGVPPGFFNPLDLGKAVMTPEQEAAVRDRNWCWKCASAMVVFVSEGGGVRFMQCKHCTTVYALAARPLPGGVPTGLSDERERCARICESLAELMECGAGDPEPGGRLRQAARKIRDGDPVPGFHGLMGSAALSAGAPSSQEPTDAQMLDWVEAQGNGMPWLARQSETGRGFRLHNDRDGLWATARYAIRAEMLKESPHG